MRNRLPGIFTTAAVAALAMALLVGGAPGAAPAKSKPLTSYDPQAKELLAKMTLDEKIGQMTQPDQEHIKDLSDIENLHIGSVLSGGSSDPKEGNSREAWTNMYLRLQEHAKKSRLGIPILFGVDGVHGHNNVIGAVIFPHNVGLGATRNPALIEKIAKISAAEIRATGIHWTFAPCVTVPQDERWGRTYEGFAEDPKIAGMLGEAATRGLQGASLAAADSVAACVKHYAGDGGTSPGTSKTSKAGLDQGDTRVDEATLRRIHLAPYIPSIRAGAATIMPSYSSWNGEKLSGHKYLMTDVLKKEFGFAGFLISDFNALDQVDPDFKKAVEKSINAGMDMAMVPQKYKVFISTLKELVNEGRVPMSRIDDAVLRILRVKFAMGLMDPKWSAKPDDALVAKFGSAEHRAVARQAVRESLVLLKNDKKTLPLSAKATRIHVAGKNADDIGNQCGGWTIDWQGKSGAVTTGGTTVLAAIQQAAPNAKVSYAKDGAGAEGASVGVVVIGETPYAEMNGDKMDLSLDPEDVAAVKAMKKAGIPVVVVMISGRPMILGEVADLADAIVAAWLPGTEGAGVADVLFGAYKPTGKLSYTWPKSMDQVPINVGDGKQGALYPFGYGLTYK